ncbi:MAG: alanine racemase C-terminal domain-containing protein [Microbacterium sp.]
MPVTDQLAPQATISRRALAENARTAAAAAALPLYGPTVVRSDAWGHGAALVREVLAAAGIGEARHANDGELIDPLTLFGLPGGAPTAQPVMRLHGSVLSVKKVAAGEGVSYGYAYRAPHDTRVALVTGGYAQGVVRALGGAVSVLLGDRLHPIVGRVAMDACVVEIGDADVAREDVLVFFGDPGRGEPSLVDWEIACGLSGGELVTAVGLHSDRREIE